MGIRVAAISVIASALSLAASAKEICNLVNGTKNPTVLFGYNGIFEQGGFEAPFISLVGADLNASAIAMASMDSRGGVNAYAFYAGIGESGDHVAEEVEHRYRVADGFIAKFRVTGRGKPDGFSFLVHRDPRGVYNLNGGTGGNLGVAGVYPRLSIGFDTCADRPTTPSKARECTQDAVILETAGMAGESSLSTVRVVLQGGKRLADGASHEIEVRYLDKPKSMIQVGIDGDFSLLGDTDLIDGLAKLLGGNKYAYIGLASATTLNAPGAIAVDGWGAEIQPGTAKIDAGEQKEATLGEDDDTITFRVNTVDSCGNPDASIFGEVIAQLKTVLSNGEEIVVSGNVTAGDDGRVKIDFFGFTHPGTYTLYVSVDGVAATGSPLERALKVNEADDGGLPLWGLILMIVAIVSAVGGLFAWSRKLKRYRDMLKAHKSLTERGREQWACQELEKDAVYAANPLSQMNVDDLKRSIDENEDKIKDLLDSAMDSEEIKRQVRALKDQGAGLREELTRIKISKQQAELESAGVGRREVQTQKARKEFGQKMLHGQ